MATESKVTADDALRIVGAGFERTINLKGNTYKNRATAIVVPAIGNIHPKVVDSWLRLMPLQNQKRCLVIVQNEEVGEAYNHAISAILADKNLKDIVYLLTIESDNIVPEMAQLQLVKSIEASNFDVMAALYWSKGNVQPFPIAFGNPGDGGFDCIPCDVTQAVMEKRVLEVNAVGMGCTLFKMELFREFDPPWFKTLTESDSDDKKRQSQDIFFFDKIRRRGRRVGVDCTCLVGHIDAEGVVW